VFFPIAAFASLDTFRPRSYVFLQPRFVPGAFSRFGKSHRFFAAPYSPACPAYSSRSKCLRYFSRITASCCDPYVRYPPSQYPYQLHPSRRSHQFIVGRLVKSWDYHPGTSLPHYRRAPASLDRILFRRFFKTTTNLGPTYLWLRLLEAMWPYILLLLLF
jgi:hypothetical protein